MEKELVIDILFYIGSGWVFLLLTILIMLLYRWAKLYILDFKRARKIYLRYALYKSLQDFDDDEKYRLINEIKKSIDKGN